MDSEDDTQGALELQAVLTRYVDSQHGYEHAAELLENQTLSAIFLEISQSRAEIVPRLASLMEAGGHEAETDGSLEGTVHRWWMSVREKMPGDDFGDVLEECIRGESALLKSLDVALSSGNIEAERKPVLELARLDVEKAISHFNAAINDDEFT